MSTSIVRRALLARSVALGMLAPLAAVAANKPDLSKPGTYYWHPEIAPSGPLVILVSLDEQRLYVYRNGIAIAASTISSGKKGHETPTGVFTILQKAKDHHSNLYNNAPMPYMQRLTWDGIALHGGALPGYPASHGCVRLPQKFAQLLFAATQRGDTVVVANSKVDARGIAFPALLAPVGAGKAQTPAAQAAASGHGEFWDESLAPSGPVSILASLAEQRVYVLRDGMVIGVAPLQATPEARFEGAVLLVMGDAPAAGGTPLDVVAARRQRWASYPLLGHPPPLRTLEDGIQAPPDFMHKVRGVLAPGATILITSLPAIRGEPMAPGAQAPMRILESDD